MNPKVQTSLSGSGRVATIEEEVSERCDVARFEGERRGSRVKDCRGLLKPGEGKEVVSPAELPEWMTALQTQ